MCHWWSYTISLTFSIMLSLSDCALASLRWYCCTTGLWLRFVLDVVCVMIDGKMIFSQLLKFCCVMLLYWKRLSPLASSVILIRKFILILFLFCSCSWKLNLFHFYSVLVLEMLTIFVWFLGLFWNTKHILVYIKYLKTVTALLAVMNKRTVLKNTRGRWKCRTWQWHLFFILIHF